jgi:hypothetical protein
MEFVLQYQNADQQGLYLGEDDAQVFGEGTLTVSSRNPLISGSVGAMCFLILGIGKPRRYYLWNCFRIERITPADDTPGRLVATGAGWMLNPPQRLEGNDFDALRQACANFMTFRNISDHPYTRPLMDLANQFRRPITDSQTLDFCNDLVQFAPGYPDVYKLRGICMMDLGDDAQAIEDFQFAKQDFETLGIDDEADFCGRVIEAIRDPKNKLTEE